MSQEAKDRIEAALVVAAGISLGMMVHDVAAAIMKGLMALLFLGIGR